MNLLIKRRKKKRRTKNQNQQKVTKMETINSKKKQQNKRGKPCKRKDIQKKATTATNQKISEQMIIKRITKSEYRYS